MKEILKLGDVYKHFPNGDEKLWVLKGLNLNVKAGESIAILGESGSGKSTLLNIIGLMIQPDKGTLSIKNVDSDRFSASVRARLRNETFGYVVQDFALAENDSAYSNVYIPLHYTRKKFDKSKRDKVLEALEITGILHRADEKVRHLSGGERQRVAIARAIVNDPSIILADEPTGSLDKETGEGIMDLLLGLNKKGATIIMVTHNRHLAQQMDRNYVLEDCALRPI